MKAGFTVVTANFLAQAKAVADSFILHNPDYKFIICLLDKINGRFDAAGFSPHKIVEVEDVGIPIIDEMNERYNLFELSNALKPYFGEYLVQKNKELKTLIYLDSDIIVFDSFHYVEEKLKEYSICLTPHSLSPLPNDDSVPSEKVFLNAGIYNGGFFALKTDHISLSFLQWWKEKLRYECFINFKEGLFVDQIWLNLVPIYFNNVFIIRHLGYNVAYWNLHERVIGKAHDVFQINQTHPLVFFHFSGYNLQEPNEISKYQNRYSFQSRSDVEPLFHIFNQVLTDNEYDKFKKFDCHYAIQKKIAIVKKMTELEEQKRLHDALMLKQRKIIEEQRWSELSINKRVIYSIIRRVKKRLNTSFPDL